MPQNKLSKIVYLQMLATFFFYLLTCPMFLHFAKHFLFPSNCLMRLLAIIARHVCMIIHCTIVYFASNQIN